MWLFPCSLTLCLLTVGETTCGIPRILQQPCGGAQVARTVVLATAREELKILPTATHVSLEMDPPAPVKPLAACSPCHHRVCNFIGDPESDHPAKALLNSDPQNGGNTYHCFKPLSLGIICYAATDSYNREKSGTQKCFIKLLAGKQLKKNCMDEDAHI